MHQLEYIRRRKGLTRGEAGHLLNVSSSYIGQIEGYHYPVTEKLLERFHVIDNYRDLDLTKEMTLKGFFFRYMIKFNYEAKDLAEELNVVVYTVHAFLSQPERFSIGRLKAAIKNMKLSIDEKDHLKHLFFKVHGIEP